MELEKAISLPSSPQYKHLWILLLSYSMVIAISNWYDSRLVLLFGLTISPGALAFPFSFLLSDTITEVYGYKNAMRAIWAALFFNCVFLAFGQLVIRLPSPVFSLENNLVFDKLLSLNFWIVCGSFVSYIISEPLNSYLVAKLKIRFNGKYIGIRFVISTIIAALIDSIFFIMIAYYKVTALSTLFAMILNIWLIKSVVEIIGLPFSVRLAIWLKNVERLDTYDNKTDFNPFRLDTGYPSGSNHYLEKAT